MNAVQIREVDTFAPFKPPGSGYVFFHGRGAGRPVPCNSLPSRAMCRTASKGRSLRALAGRHGESSAGPPSKRA